MPLPTHATSSRGDALTRVRGRADYTPAEQRFSALLCERVRDLLEGKRNRVELLRHYPGEPGRVGVIATPPDVRREQLRPSVVERLSWQAMDFIRADTDGGPVSQSVGADGCVVECQSFPTKYPHIIIERCDRFTGPNPEPLDITWCLRRVQNQRAQTQLNHMLDATNLAFELVRFVR